MADEKNIGTPAEEEIEIITLTDENGEDMDFEFLDLVEYEGKRYAVLLPPVEDVEGEDENEDEEVLILQVEDDGNEENESYVFVDDDDILTAVFDIFKEKFKDEFDFSEELIYKKLLSSCTPYSVKSSIPQLLTRCMSGFMGDFRNNFLKQNLEQ